MKNIKNNNPEELSKCCDKCRSNLHWEKDFPCACPCHIPLTKTTTAMGFDLNNPPISLTNGLEQFNTPRFYK